MLQSALDGRGPCYTQSEVAELCAHATDVALRMHRFQHANLVAHFCDLLMKRPLVLLGVIDCLTEAEFRLLFPTVQSFFPAPPKLKLSSLGMASRPLIGPDAGHLRVMWSQRIYDTEGVPSTQCDMMEISSSQYTFSIASTAWSQLLMATVDDDLGRCADVMGNYSSAMN